MAAGRGQPGGPVRLIGLAAWRGVGELYNSEGLTHAASVAYYALISLFPLLLPEEQLVELPLEEL